LWRKGNKKLWIKLEEMGEMGMQMVNKKTCSSKGKKLVFGKDACINTEKSQRMRMNENCIKGETWSRVENER